jgi:hypothetical protein
MEINREQFEKHTQSGQQEAKQKRAKQSDLKTKWDVLHKKTGVKEEPSQFPLIQYKPPEGQGFEN